MNWMLPDAERQPLLEMRRDLHKHPELSWQEYRTAGKVEEALRALGLEPVTGVAKTGLYADIGTEGPMVVLRADMDALPVSEMTDVPFKSEVDGQMHACGHDAHTSCLVAVARRLVADPPAHGRVRLLFQPAEEGAGGAEVMIEEGVLRDPEPLAIYGAHVWSQLPTGMVGVVPGTMMGSVDRLEIEVHGRGGHGAIPHNTRDAIVAASQLVVSLQSIVSRRIDPLQSVVVSIGQFNAGSAFNVISPKASLVGTVRTLDKEVWQKIPDLLEEVIHNTVAAYGCTAEVKLTRQQMPLVNHPGEVALLQEVAAEWVSPEKIVPFRTLGGEDFASYLEEIPGCFFFVGCGGKTDSAEEQPPHHNPHFWLDEDGFDLSVRLLEGCARRHLERSV